VLDDQPAARAERQPLDVIVLRRVLRASVDDQRRRLRLAEARRLIFCAAVT
jgi:hypothetical protein